MKIEYNAADDVLTITFDDNAPIVSDETRGAFKIGYTPDGVADIVVSGARARGFWPPDGGAP